MSQFIIIFQNGKAGFTHFQCSVMHFYMHFNMHFYVYLCVFLCVLCYSDGVLSSSESFSKVKVALGGDGFHMLEKHENVSYMYFHVLLSTGPTGYSAH